MSTVKYKKIQELYKNWTPHTVLTIRDLKELGYSNSNIQKYLNSGWIESIGEGAYKKAGDTIKLEGAVYALSKYKPCHIGGKSAIEEQVVTHDIEKKEREVFLFLQDYSPLPKWFKDPNWCTEIKYIKSRFIKGDIGISYKQCGDFKVPISSRERAILEYIFLLGKEHTFEECNLLFQSLNTLRPNLIQELLESCSSVKVKKTFLLLASDHKYEFLNELNLDKIDFGFGYREIEKTLVDPKFQINHSHNFDKKFKRKSKC